VDFDGTAQQKKLHMKYKWYTTSCEQYTVSGWYILWHSTSISFYKSRHFVTTFPILQYSRQCNNINHTLS